MVQLEFLLNMGSVHLFCLIILLTACRRDLQGLECKQANFWEYHSYLCALQTDIHHPSVKVCHSSNLPDKSSTLPQTTAYSTTTRKLTTIKTSINLYMTELPVTSQSFKTLPPIKTMKPNTAISTITNHRNNSGTDIYNNVPPDSVPLSNKGWIVAAVLCPMIIVCLLVTYIYCRKRQSFTRRKEPEINQYINTAYGYNRHQPSLSSSDIVVLSDDPYINTHVDLCRQSSHRCQNDSTANQHPTESNLNFYSIADKINIDNMHEDRQYLEPSSVVRIDGWYPIVSTVDDQLYQNKHDKKDDFQYSLSKPMNDRRVQGDSHSGENQTADGHSPGIICEPLYAECADEDYDVLFQQRKRIDVESDRLYNSFNKPKEGIYDRVGEYLDSDFDSDTDAHDNIYCNLPNTKSEADC